ncbi:DUF2512 family protein [Bacillota bacterium LX-D]|nr:DUF2512 family protein [Bacillota bacterium LX-D]
MSKTSMALIAKFLMTFVAAWISFGLIDSTAFSGILSVAIAGTVLNYLIGDLFILPKFGNLVASVGDGLMAALTAYVFDLIMNTFNTSLTGLFIFALIVAIAEYFFHIYLLKSEKVAP